MIYLNYDNFTNLKAFLKIQEVVKMKYLDDAMDNMHWNWKFWTWQQHQFLICCSLTFYRLENNPCCQLWTTTKVFSPNSTDIYYFCNANYTPPKSKNLYSLFFHFMNDNNWCCVNIKKKFLSTIPKLTTCYMHSSNTLDITISWTSCFILCILTKNGKFQDLIFK